MFYEFEYDGTDLQRENIISNNSDKILYGERISLIDSKKILIFKVDFTVSEKINALETDVIEVAETTAIIVEDNTSTAETLASALLVIENLKAEIAILKGV